MCARAPPARRSSRQARGSRGPPARLSRWARGALGNQPNAAPLSGRQLRALALAVIRELTWGLPNVSREVKRWHRLAEQIPTRQLREDALDALNRKRGQSDGAALFSILPRKRNLSYLRLLVAYQIVWDYLDSVSERGASQGLANGRQLHLALVDALDPDGPIRDYYQYSPWREDGGYLRALVETCRECCRRLPLYPRMRELLLRDAHRAEVLALNHELDGERRDCLLKEWVAREFPSGHEASWYELTGAASAGLAAFALLALACEPDCCEDNIDRTHSAYFPWASALACMLDSYADQPEDTANGDHSYIAHYPTLAAAVAGTAGLVRRCLHELSSLRDGEKHVVIAASMVALYLSKDSMRRPSLRRGSSEIVKAGGSLTRALVPILRLWRAAYSLRST